MPEEQPPAGDDDAPVTDAPDPDAGAKKALDQERKARREAEKQLKEMAARLKEIEDKDKSETDRLREQVEQLKSEAATANAQILRSEIAAEKGLTPAQAKRLVGSTREELEADADDILATFPTAPGVTPPPSEKPRPDLRGGTDPTEYTEVDVRAVVESIPRGI